MAGRIAAFLVALALFAVGLAGVGGMASQAPAFNRDRELRTITQTTRVVRSDDMYVLSNYLFQVGYGFLRAVLLPVVTGAPDAPPGSRTALERFRIGVDLTEAALRRDPANAFIWQAHLEGLVAIGAEDARIMAAFESAWRRAPATPQLAQRRRAVHEILDAAGRLEAERRALIARDRALLAADRAR